MIFKGLSIENARLEGTENRNAAVRKGSGFRSMREEGAI